MRSARSIRAARCRSSVGTPLAWPGACDRVCANGRTNGSACRSSRFAMCRATRRKSRIGRGTYGAAQHGGRRQRAQGRAPTRDHRQGPRSSPRDMMEADVGDIDFKDGQYRRHRHRQDDRRSSMSPRPPTRRWAPPHRQSSGSAGSRPAATARTRRAIPTARMSARSRSIPRLGEVSDRCATHVVDDLGRIINPMIVRRPGSWRRRRRASARR